jgi:hypothetical protein
VAARKCGAAAIRRKVGLLLFTSLPEGSSSEKGAIAGGNFRDEWAISTELTRLVRKIDQNCMLRIAYSDFAYSGKRENSVMTCERVDSWLPELSITVSQRLLRHSSGS